MRQVIHPQEATIQFIRYNTGKKHILLRQVFYRMTIILFTVFAGKTCSAVSPLPQDFYANFGGDPFTDHPPHDRFMRSVFFRMNDRTASFMPQWLFIRSVHDRTPGRAPVCDES